MNIKDQLQKIHKKKTQFFKKKVKKIGQNLTNFEESERDIVKFYSDKILVLQKKLVNMKDQL